MTEKNHTEDSKNEDFLDRFSQSDRENIRELWEASRQARPEQPEIDEREVNEAWKNVEARTQNKNDNSTSSPKEMLQTAPSNLKWWAAAAIVLLVAGTGFLLTPKTMTAPNGEIITATLPDGSQVELNSGTALQYNRLFAYTNRTVELSGEAFFAIEKGDDPFIVQTSQAEVKVTGTKFNVESRNEAAGKSTDVTVSEGQVQFYRMNKPTQAVTLNAGQHSRLAPEMENPSKPARVNIARFLDWRKATLTFNNQPLDTIFQKLEERFNITILLENTALGRETLTAYYSNPQTSESVIKDICRVKGLRYEKTTNGYRIYE